jgi:hypothetical protein
MMPKTPKPSPELQHRDDGERTYGDGPSSPVVASSGNPEDGALVWAVNTTNGQPVRLYGHPQCSCCEGYAAYLRQNAFVVDVKPTNDLAEISRKAGVPETLQGCHTMFVSGYVVDGHVPVGPMESGSPIMLSVSIAITGGRTPAKYACNAQQVSARGPP